MSEKAPSAGQKATRGQNVPEAQEATGVVAPDSLAAESEAFASNRDAAPAESLPITTASRSSTAPSSPPTASTTSPREPQGAAAPTYANTQGMRDPPGPHGKNLKEGGFAGEGPGASIDAEPGSEHDPARLAEHKFLSQTGPGSRGTRQGGIDTEHPYEVLESETSA